MAIAMAMIDDDDPATYDRLLWSISISIIILLFVRMVVSNGCTNIIITIMLYNSYRNRRYTDGCIIIVIDVVVWLLLLLLLLLDLLLFLSEIRRALCLIIVADYCYYNYLCYLSIQMKSQLPYYSSTRATYPVQKRRRRRRDNDDKEEKEEGEKK